MATGGVEVDSRVTCSVCLEPYRGRQPKILPCFHTFCVPCLAGLATRRDFTQVSDTPALDADEEEGRSADTVTCPTCRHVISVPAGGVNAFQTNFYLDSSSREEDGQPVPCTLCDGDQTAQFNCGQCQSSFCPQCQRAHNKLCRGGQVRALQDPSDSSSSSSSAAQSPSHRQVRQQLQKVEDALKKLAEEKRKLNQEREAMDDSISVRYATLLRHAADARDTCCLSLREVYDGLMERLHSNVAEARLTRDTLQQQLSSSQPAPVSASQLRAALFMEGELPMILDRDLGSCSLLQYHMEDNTSLMMDTVQSFMGKIVRASLSSGPAQSQAPSGSPCFQGSHGAMPSDGADPKSLSDLYKKVEDLAGQVTSLQSQLSTAHSKLSTEQSALHREVTTLKNHNVQLTTEQAGLQREVRAMRDKHAIVHQDLAVLTSEKDKVSAELGKLQKDVASLQTDTSSSTLQIDFVQLKADHGDVVAKLSSAQADITALQGDDNKMKKDITDLQGDDDKMKKDIMALQGEDNKMKQDITTLQGDNDKMKKDIMALQGDDNKMKKDITALQGDDNKMKKDIMALQGDDNKMKKDITALQGDDNKMKKDITALQRNGTSMKDKLKSDMAKIQGNLSNLESRFVTANTQVGFSAWMSETVTTNKEQTLICDCIVSNVGGRYHTQSGVFTTPVAGTYCFLANASPNHPDVKKKARLVIVVEGEVKGYVYAMGHSWSTGHTVVRLTAGQKVWLRSSGDGEYTFSDGGWTIFSGALLQAEV